MHDQGSGTSVRVRDMPREEQRRFHAFAYGRLQGSLLTLMFAMPALLLVGSLLSGTLGPSGTYTATFKATTVPGGMSATEDVQFVILPAGDILLRNGFDVDDPNLLCH